jgi:metal-responsive CopG/Arc/MetJ family transcriptional regulator
MKVKASITLSKDVLASVDRLAGPGNSRSAFIERILRKYLQVRTRRILNARDLARINKSAAKLNAEALDVLSYQFSEHSHKS